MWSLIETTNHYFNYGDALLENIIFTDWARDKFNVLMLSLWSMILRFHVISLLCMIFSGFQCGFYIDAVAHTFISIICTFYRRFFYNFMEQFSLESRTLVNYLLDNYTLQNYRKWKRNILLICCIYGIIACLLFPINSFLIIIYIIEYVVAFIVVDVTENKIIDNMIQEYKQRPKHVIHANFSIEDFNYNYVPTEREELVESVILPDSPTTTKAVKGSSDSGLSTSRSVGQLSIMVFDDYKNP